MDTVEGCPEVFGDGALVECAQLAKGVVENRSVVVGQIAPQTAEAVDYAAVEFVDGGEVDGERCQLAVACVDLVDELLFFALVFDAFDLGDALRLEAHDAVGAQFCP